MWETFTPPPEASSRSHPYELSVSTQIFTLQKANQSGLRMHMMLHGVMEVPRVPLSNAACRQVAIYPTPQQVRRVQRELRSFVFFLPSDSCSGELKASSVMQRFGPESGADEGRAVHGRMDGWMKGRMKAAQIKTGGVSFLLIDLTVQQQNPLIFT